ncbi:biotin transporter BioY, partial [Streptomyces sioyaensis]
MNTDSVRPAVTELRLSAFKTHRGVTLPLGPLTLLSGGSGSGKSSALQAYAILARLGSGESLARALAEVAGGPSACVPTGARPDGQGRRGFRIGCTVDGPAGPVSLDLAVQAEPELRIVGERLTGGGETLLTTALTDPTRPAVQAAWHTAGATPVTRAPLPDDRLGTSLLPLRVAGKTAGQRLVLAAAEQVVVALRSAFVCDPRPEVMRAVGAV